VLVRCCRCGQIVDDDDLAGLGWGVTAVYRFPVCEKDMTVEDAEVTRRVGHALGDDQEGGRE
jgi:hypothetical protein